MNIAAWRVGFMVVLVMVAGVAPSSIPMWEFLSRGEKIKCLINVFTNQVAEHCDMCTMPADCNQVLMHGLTNLAQMEDKSLDKMDPYQRGAMDIIWDQIMHNNQVTGSHSATEDYTNEPVTSDNQLGAVSSNSEQDVGSPQYLMGPMAVRVFPDGSPVPEDMEKPLLKDDDAEEFLAMSDKPVPSMVELLAQKHHTTT